MTAQLVVETNLQVPGPRSPEHDEELPTLSWSERERDESINVFRGLMFAVPVGIALDILLAYLLYLLIR